MEHQEMRYNSEEFEAFSAELAKKLMIKDLYSLFSAIDPMPPTVFIGSNGYWNYRTSMFRVFDNMLNGDPVLIIVYNKKSYNFRESEVKRKFPNKNFLVHVYEELMKG